MELEAVNKVGPGGHATAAAGLEGFVRSIVESLLAQAVQAAGESVVLFLLAMGSLSDDGGVVGEKDVDERYVIPSVRRSKNQVTAENKDDGDSEDDDDEDEDEDDDGADEDEDGGEEESSGDEGNGKGEDDDPETGGGSEGDNDDEDDDDEEGDEEDEDEDEDEEEEQEEDDEEQQRPSKRRK